MTEVSRIDPSNPTRRLRVLPALPTGSRLFVADGESHARNSERPAGMGAAEWQVYELASSPRADAAGMFHFLAPPEVTHSALSLHVIDGTVRSHAWRGRSPWRDVPPQCFATESAIVLDAIDEAEAREALAAHLAATAIKPTKSTTRARA